MHRSRNDSPRRHAHRPVFGLLLIGLGTLALFDLLHELPALLRSFWPLLLMVWGLARLLSPGSAGRRLFALAPIVVGAWLMLNPYGLLSWPAAQVWPWLLMLAGLSLLLRGDATKR